MILLAPYLPYEVSWTIEWALQSWTPLAKVTQGQASLSYWPHSWPIPEASTCTSPWGA